MSDWEPTEHHKDPMVNAVLNVAEQLARLATAHGKLLYALKYSEGTGLSLAEAIEVGAKSIGEGLQIVSTAIDDHASATAPDDKS